MFEEEQYYEPSLADEIIVEFQEKMKSVLLGSVKFEIENIKEENKNLKKQNEKLQNQVNQIKQKEIELEHLKSNLKAEVRRERLSKLMEDFQVVMYKIDDITEKIPKCNKCDKNRKIKFESPSGKQMEEYCTCNRGKAVYIPKEHICTEFRVDREDNAMLMWYEENHESDHDWYGYNNSNLCKTVYKDGMDYKNLNRYDTYFKTKQDCQKYCDWLNKNKT
jgi:hypothetical protein